MAVPILLYHSIDTICAPAYRRWAVPPDTFARHLDLIRDRGCRPVTMAQIGAHLVDGVPLPEGSVAITFDDGLADFADTALPILERYGFASTLFVTTGYVGSTASWLSPLGEGGRRMMSWEQVLQLPQRNVECGAHSHTHSELDILAPASMKREIELSKALLEERLGRPVVSFAYPHGYHTRAMESVLEAAGFKSACSVGSGRGRFGLTRLIVDGATTDAVLGSYLDGDLDRASSRLSAWLHRPLQIGWRTYRRTRSARLTPDRQLLPTSMGA